MTSAQLISVAAKGLTLGNCIPSYTVSTKTTRFLINHIEIRLHSLIIAMTNNLEIHKLH